MQFCPRALDKEVYRGKPSNFFGPDTPLEHILLAALTIHFRAGKLLSFSLDEILSAHLYHPVNK